MVSRAFLTGVPVALLIYYVLPTAGLQVPFLIGATLVVLFAAGNQVLLVCFAAFITALTSLAAVQVRPVRRRIGLWLGVGLNLALLIFFKYKQLLIPQTLYYELFGASPAMAAIYDYALPVGISFYVFHGISLIVDSYRDRHVIGASAESWPSAEAGASALLQRGPSIRFASALCLPTSPSPACCSGWRR